MKKRNEEIQETLDQNELFLKDDYAGVDWVTVSKNLEEIFNNESDDDEEEKTEWSVSKEQLKKFPKLYLDNPNNRVIN